MTQEQDGNPRVVRRTFLDTLLRGSVAAGLAGMAWPVAKFLVPPHAPEGVEAEVEAASDSGSIQPGQAVKFEFHGSPALLVNSKAGFMALSAVCTHLGCIVEWDPARAQVVCPCHNAMFDIYGNIVSGPAPLPLERFEVDVRDNKVMVRRKG